MHDVVPATVPKQVFQDSGAEDERGQKPAPRLVVEAHPWPDGDHRDTLETGVLPPRPLSQRQVRDLMARVRKPFRERAVPALRAADAVWIQAVVDQANTHDARAAGLQNAGPRRLVVKVAL